jgi:cytidine deaminase
MSRERLPLNLQVTGMREFVANFPTAARDARLMREEARHHRQNIPDAAEPPILVGAVALGMDRQGNMGWYNGANQNLSPGDNPTKICAEWPTLQKMESDGKDYLIGMVISGTPQVDKQSGRGSLVLATCGLCRPLVQRFGSDEHSLVAQLHPTANIAEIDTPSELVFKHQRQSGSQLYVVPHMDDAGMRIGQFEQGLHDMIESGLPVSDIGRHAVGIEFSARHASKLVGAFEDAQAA